MAAERCPMEAVSAHATTNPSRGSWRAVKLSAERDTLYVRDIAQHDERTVTIFELVRLALDELYSATKQTYGGNADNEIRKRIAYLSTSYGNLTSIERKPVDYKDPATRFAYVFKYVAAHGDYLVQGLKALRSELGDNIFKGHEARVSCVGGGPGSDAQVSRRA